MVHKKNVSYVTVNAKIMPARGKRACSLFPERSLSYAKINKIYRMLKLYHIKITVRQHCVNNSSKIIKNNGNNKFIVYFCIRYCVLLHKISCGSAVSRPVKLCFPVLLLHSPCILFVAAKIINLSDLADL